ncbi:MAG: histidine ammonia-lyase, partial [Candidatus Asgardarchaeum californiense]
NKVQDAYSIRCVPQIHAPVKDTLKFVEKILDIELNSATDNPLIFHDGSVISGGNFHGEPISAAMDYLAIAMTILGNVSERRIARLIDDTANEGLPLFLIDKEKVGLNSGYMIPQYVAAALASENKVLAHPASVDSIPTSANFEDFVSMGSIAARKAYEIVKNTRRIIAIEL